MGAAPFRDLCTLGVRDDGRYDATIAEFWTIGPKVHGGVMLAVCAAAARQKVREQDSEPMRAMQPLSVAVDYLGAPVPGAVILDVNLRKTGKQICLADVELIQGDRTLVRAAVTLGHLDTEPPAYQRDSLIDMPIEPTPDAIVYDDSTDMGKIVNVAKGCDLRLDPTSAAFLEQKKGEPSFRLWIRPFEDDANDPDVVLLFAMMAGDISPPVVFNRGMFGWSPTIQLTTYLQRKPAPGWLRVMSSAKSIGVGNFDEDHLIVDSTGAVIVQSRQLALLPRS
ncbi:thioesterase family protein [Antrihabitans cavernicola]|uniref:Thioesterase family protein n=1 Tax=Antrihabitans cavernicola TaxID=2495913 RepID=A0A5A7SCD7_9NOCA|nr:thioesterase family protein [Spelaeibacter cavernicola]KAA0022407.1 thioesterase family protein [Spelaeibacter cavernicola]